ncbi:MAG: PspA/IM30 family protein [Opitutaceae bacterium]|nr:PspA/IM30 family protein [Cytophagales bacterium]
MWKTIWSRCNNLFKSKALSVLDSVENPVEMYELAVQESDNNLQNLIKAIAIALADQKNRERELNQAMLEAESWRTKAKAALEHSQSDLAKSALERKVIAENKVQEYSTLNEMLKKKIDEQKVQLDRFKVKHEELKAKKSIYTAKYQTAKAQKQIAESLGGLNKSALSGVSRLEEKINRLEAESEAIFELTSGQNEIDTQLEKLETSSKVNDELELLQLEMAKDNERKQIDKMKRIEQQINHVPTTKKEEKNVDKMLNDFYGKTSQKALPPDGKDAMNNFFK